MAEKAQSMEETPKAEAGGTPTPPKRGLGHRGADPRDTAAELAARAHAISLEAGSKMAGAMRDVIHAAAGISGFVVDSARDLLQFMVRRGQMAGDEADKLLREAEEAHARRVAGGWEPTGLPPMPEPPPAPVPSPIVAAPTPAPTPTLVPSTPAVVESTPTVVPEIPRPAAKQALKPAAKAPVKPAAAKEPVKHAKPATKVPAKAAAKSAAKAPAKPVKSASKTPAKSGAAVKTSAKAASKSTAKAPAKGAKKAARKR
jgi:hypothetical protein